MSDIPRMRKASLQWRLREIIGRDAYKVPVMTFHSFGTDIMNQYPEYFYSGASFRPADELTWLRIVAEIWIHYHMTIR